MRDFDIKVRSTYLPNIYIYTEVLLQSKQSALLRPFGEPLSHIFIVAYWSDTRLKECDTHDHDSGAWVSRASFRSVAQFRKRTVAKNI